MKRAKVTVLRSGKIAVQVDGTRVLIPSRSPDSVFTVTSVLAALGYEVQAGFRIFIAPRRRRRRKKAIK